MRICAVIYTICTITLSANDLINDLNHFKWNSRGKRSRVILRFIMATLCDDLNCHKVLKLFLQSCSDLFFSYLTNRELGILDRAITDINLRKIYTQHAAVFYRTNRIQSFAELEWVMKRGIVLTKCNLDFYFENPKYTQCKSTFS